MVKLTEELVSNFGLGLDLYPSSTFVGVYPLGIKIKSNFTFLPSAINVVISDEINLRYFFYKFVNDDFRYSFKIKGIQYLWLGCTLFDTTNNNIVAVREKYNTFYIQYGYLLPKPFLRKLERHMYEVVYVDDLYNLLEPIVSTNKVSEIRELGNELLKEVIKDESK